MILDRLTLEQKVDLLLLSHLPQEDQGVLLSRVLPPEVEVVVEPQAWTVFRLKYRGSEYFLNLRNNALDELMAVLHWVEEMDKREVELLKESAEREIVQGATVTEKAP